MSSAQKSHERCRLGVENGKLFRTADATEDFSAAVKPRLDPATSGVL